MGHERLFDYKFDFQTYIEQQLREIDDLEERKFAKALMQDGLMTIIEETERKYADFEKRVYDEIADTCEKYEIRTTVMKKTDYDPADPDWFPVAQEDSGTDAFRGEQRWEVLAAKENRIVRAHLFIKANERICREICQGGELLDGSIQTDQGAFAAKFQLRKSETYAKRIEFLYKLFQGNQIPWVTVNRALLDHFFELHVYEVDEEIPKEAQLTGIEVAYGNYKDFIAEDRIPVWNIQRVTYNSDEFPLPRADDDNYEHEFPLKELGAEHDYLLAVDAAIRDVRHEAGKLIIVTPMETFNRWVAYKIVRANQASLPDNGYPVLSNHKKSGFTRSFIKRRGTQLKTKADIMRRMNELDIGAFIQYEGCEIIDDDGTHPPVPDMNDFIGDRIFDHDSRRILLLKFTAKDAAHYLNDAMVRFAISELQLDEGEYRCVGVLI